MKTPSLLAEFLFPFSSVAWDAQVIISRPNPVDHSNASFLTPVQYSNLPLCFDVNQNRSGPQVKLLSRWRLPALSYRFLGGVGNDKQQFYKGDRDRLGEVCES